jgi:7-dehydrocholesterol reductase
MHETFPSTQTTRLFWGRQSLLPLLLLSVFVNYFADRQRQKVRATNGQCTVWGKRPETITASYTTERGERRNSLLLVSGWWGLSRHFHYIPEVLGAFFWSVPALFGHLLPYLYVLFLAILLTDRAFRDEQRCADKYGADWRRYCERVPYRIVPGVL